MSNKVEASKPFGWICTGPYGAYQFFRADFMRMEWLEGEDAHAFKPLYEQSPLHDAAPDLLEALKMLETTCGDGLEIDHPIRVYARSVILKATTIQQLVYNPE